MQEYGKQASIEMTARRLTPTMHRWSPRVTVAAVVERDGRYLLVRELINGEQVINQPAGHLEAGESLLAAVRRETREETGWRFVPEALLGVYRWVHPKRRLTFLRFAFTGQVCECNLYPVPFRIDILFVNLSIELPEMNEFF